MAAEVARRHRTNNTDSNTQARHTEIARRYTWQAQQRRKRSDDDPDPARLLTLIRMRELERLFVSRYGRVLPDDDAGRDDLFVAAHHITFLRGDVIKHIMSWARAWAPWMPSAEVERLAERVAAEPRKWTADVLAWRLRLSWVERTELRITTIGAFDMNKAERETERKRRRAETERARRAKRSTGRPRGRPKKCVASRDSTIAGHGFSPQADALAREVPGTGTDAAAFTKKNLNTSRVAGSLLDLVKDQTPVPASPDPRAAPPPEVIAEAIEIASTYAGKGNCYWRYVVGQQEARRLLDLLAGAYGAGLPLPRRSRGDLGLAPLAIWVQRRARPRICGKENVRRATTQMKSAPRTRGDATATRAAPARDHRRPRADAGQNCAASNVWTTPRQERAGLSLRHRGAARRDRGTGRANANAGTDCDKRAASCTRTARRRCGRLRPTTPFATIHGPGAVGRGPPSRVGEGPLKTGW